MRELLYQGGPDCDAVIGRIERDHPLSYFDGQYFQPGNTDEVARRRSEAEPYILGTAQPEFLTLERYQQWAELDWKEPHGTREALKRYGNKSSEETVESGLELRELWADPVEVPDEVVKPVEDELGDKLWTHSALASIGAVSLDRATRTYLKSKGAFQSMIPETPLMSVDMVIAEGFIPRDPYYDHPVCDQGEESEPLLELGLNHSMTRSNISYQYGLGRHIVTLDMFQGISRELEETVGYGVVLIGYYAQKWAGSSLSRVAQHNMQKISERVATDTIDRP